MCGCLICPVLGTWPATQACALTGNRTGNPLIYRPMLSPLSYTSQGYIINFLRWGIYVLGGDADAQAGSGTSALEVPGPRANSTPCSGCLLDDGA